MAKPPVRPRQGTISVRWNDVWTMSVPAEQRQRMARIRSKGTTPELLVRGIVHRLGFRFCLHRRDLPGCPDIVLPRVRKIIDVRGCYWHAHVCQRHKKRTVRREYWGPKLARNVARDRRTLRLLRSLGWQVHIVWECTTVDTERLTRRLARFLGVEISQ